MVFLLAAFLEANREKLAQDGLAAAALQVQPYWQRWNVFYRQL